MKLQLVLAYIKAFLKQFLIMISIFIGIYLILGLIKIGFYHAPWSDLFSNLIKSKESYLIISFGFGLINGYKQMKLQKNLPLAKKDKSEIRLQLKDMISVAKLAIVAEDNNMVSFRLPFWHSVWREFIEIKILDDELIIQGPKKYINEVIMELKERKVIAREIE